MTDERHTGSRTLRDTLSTIIFGHDTPAGRLFDVVLIWSIMLSVSVVMLDSLKDVRDEYGGYLFAIEWFFTGLFTIEYILRLFSSPRPLKYMVSFFGIIDLLAILPTYFSLIVAGSQYLIVVRILRVLRIFRVLKFAQYIGEARLLMAALRAARRKIFLFLFTVLVLVVIIGSFMYLVEGEENGFTSIPRSIYWAIVTLTTVGYGDISPKTPLGQAFASVIMILGYGIIAVPTGIVTVELGQSARKRKAELICPSCDLDEHDETAVHCKRCGAKLGTTKTS
jgi:voltage-gated potassium channel